MTGTAQDGRDKGQLPTEQMGMTVKNVTAIAEWVGGQAWESDLSENEGLVNSIFDAGG